MTMSMGSRHENDGGGSFKARCLAVMDEVQAKREAIVITKRGKPVVKLVPADAEKDDIFGLYQGQGEDSRRYCGADTTPEEWGDLY
jgi:prevent-host-death family protein